MTPESRRKRFAALVGQPEPLVMPGAHDALSARMVEAAGFEATYIGSYGTSAAAFGLPDVGTLTLTELAEQAGRVADAVAIPVLADAESGFFEAANIWRTVQAFERAGVCGMHLEDHAGAKHTALGRSLLPRRTVGERITAAVAARTDPDFQVVGRTDAMWVSGDLDEAVERMRAYAAAGADMLFPTGITPAQLAKVRSSIPGPVMVLGDLPASGVQEMADAGADVIVYYGFTVTAASRGMSNALAELKRTGDVRLLNGLLEDPVTFESRLPYQEYADRALQFTTDS